MKTLFILNIIATSLFLYCSVLEADNIKTEIKGYSNPEFYKAPPDRETLNNLLRPTNTIGLTDSDFGLTKSQIIVAEAGDAGYGACGGYCNDIRPDARYQCKSTQRPAYDHDGYCICIYDEDHCR